MATGKQRDDAISVLQNAAELLADGDIDGLEALMKLVEPEPIDPRLASVAQVIGVGLRQLDTWSADPVAAPMLVQARSPLWTDRAGITATEILQFAVDGRAFANLRTLIVKHGGLAVLEGTVFAVSATAIAWADLSGFDVVDVTSRHLG